MRTWYLGAVFTALPMFGNGILICAGDSAGASRLMMAGMGLNLVLNPVLILGLAGVPAFGIRGSALATNVAQAVLDDAVREPEPRRPAGRPHP